MSQIPREPQTAVLSSPLHPRVGKRVTRSDVDIDALWESVRKQDWGMASQHLLALGRHRDGLARAHVDRLLKLADDPGTPPEVRAAGWFAIGGLRESAGDLLGAETAYQTAYEVQPAQEILLQRTRLRRRLFGPSQAAEILWPQLRYELPGAAPMFDEAAKIALDLDDLETAEDLIRQSEQIDPKSPGRWAAKSRYLLVRGRYDESMALARDLVSEQPSLGRVLLAAGLAATQQQHLDPGLLDAVLGNLPEDPWALYRLAELLVEDQRFQDADPVLTHALIFAPGWSFATLWLRGSTRAMLGRFDDAAGDLDTAATIRSDPRLTQIRGEVARLAGRPEAAVTLLRSLSETERPAWVSASLGMALRQLQDIDQARTEFARALELDEVNIDALCGLAEIELLGEDPASWDRAEQLLDRAFNLDPRSARTVALQAETLRRRGASREAVDRFTLALDLDQGFTWARGSRAQALIALGEYEEAIGDLMVAVQQSPNESWIISELVDALEHARPMTADAELKELTGAIEQEHAGVNLRPICVARARLASRQQRWTDAERQFSEARQKFGDDPDLLEGHVEALRQLRRFDEALEALDAAAEPLPPDLRWTRIELLWDLGRLVEARPYVEQMLAENESQVPASAIAALGEGYRLAGQLENARKYLTMADQLAPKDAWTLASLGAVELDCGNIEPARRLLQEALDLEQNYPFALSQLMNLELSVGNDEAVMRVVDANSESTDPMIVAMVIQGCYGLGQYAKALRAIDAYLSREANDRAMQLARGWVEIALGLPRDAEETFVAAAQPPAAGSDILQLTDVLLRVERWDRAVKVIQDARDPEDLWAQTGLAAILLEAGLWDDALSVAVTEPSFLEESMEALRVTACVLSHAGSPEEALQAAQGLIRAAPTNTEYLVVGATISQRAGHDEQAQEWFAQAAGLLGRRTHLDADEQIDQARCLLHTGHPTEAAERLLRTLPVTDRVAAVLFDLVMASLAGGDHRQARVLLNRFGDELATLPGPRLRGIVGHAAFDLESIRGSLTGRASGLAADTVRRLDDVAAHLPAALETLMQADIMPAVQRWTGSVVI